MSKKFSKQKQKQKNKQKQNSDRVIQYAAIAVILLALVFVAFPYAKNWLTPAPELPQPATPVSAEVSPVCAAFDSIPAAEQYDRPPMGIDSAAQYFTKFKMQNGGEFTVQLYADKAPQTVNSFVFLACKGFYNGLTFHRVIDGFMAQGGDPTGMGIGGPGYQFEDEQNGLTFDRAGLLAMANSGADTNGSQFFITFAPTEWLDGKHTIFGEVVEGMDVVNGLTRGDPDTPGFQGDVMESVTIVE